MFSRSSTPMTYPIRLVHSSAPAPHGNFHRFILRLLFLLSAAPSATAQMSTNSSSSSGSSSNVNLSIILVILIGFLIMLFLSMYFRPRHPDAAHSGRGSRRAAAAPPSKTGLDPEVIDSFPIFQYSDVKHLKFGKRGGTLECAVCIAGFENDDALRVLPKCDHVFHPDCIDAWLASHPTCPVCRANLAPIKNEPRQVTDSTQPNDSDRAGSQSQNPDLVAVDVEECGNRQVHASDLPKRKLPRSHSTGHSLSHPGEDLERYTLRLPMELKREITSRSCGSLKRTISCVVVSQTEQASSRRAGGEGRSTRGRSDRWVFSRTPPFLSRARSNSKVGLEGDLTAVEGFNRSTLADVTTPFDCLALKRDAAAGQTSTRLGRPPV